MTLQQIYYMIVTAEVGSMNKAAEKLFISQPTLTSAIKELESELGITIFERTNRGVLLTDEGNDFLMSARQIYQQYELLKEKYGPQGSIKHKFSVSCQHYSFAVKAFVETVKQFDTLKYEFRIKECQTMEVIKDVGNSKSEIGILYISDYNRKYIQRLMDENGLGFEPIITCDAYVYLYKDHPLAKEKSIRLNQLQDYPLIKGMMGPFI